MISLNWKYQDYLMTFFLFFFLNVSAVAVCYKSSEVKSIISTQIMVSILHPP